MSASSPPSDPPLPPLPAVPLSSLHRGARARLHSTTLTCEDCLLLNAMGLTDQCELRVCRRGEPCIVQVHATRLGISAAMARRILVSPCDQTQR